MGAYLCPGVFVDSPRKYQGVGNYLSFHQACRGNGFHAEKNIRVCAGTIFINDSGNASFDEEKPDFVLLDIFLEGDLTGIDLAHPLKQRQIAFVYLSAKGWRQDPLKQLIH